MNRDAIEAFFQAYVQAFVRGDVDGVAACWRFPATVSTSKGDRVLSEADVRENVEMLVGFYRSQRMVDARSKVSAVKPLARDEVRVTAIYELYDEAGGLIASWPNDYVLREEDGAIHVAVSFAEAEEAAWAARDIPFIDVGPEGEPILHNAVKMRSAR